ncbi:endonuclease [Yeosuana aromativorans]|uniref:Endonuclease n=1 Tax=Yeosuana aromativorans TaxID=288019 RepID=A0A8J3BJW1_9FLAO|nr:S1/P1 nuclease [Yeosuana aromativorans]GGK15759.1 endonuclease [Yeosuana aromativorans]
MKYLFTCALLFLLLIPCTTNASDDWGATGHRTVGRIAEQYLKGHAKRKIKKLLHGESLALVSTYADEIKSDKRYDKFYTWHYINMPLDVDYDPSKQNPDGDLVSGINYCKTIISDKNASDDDKIFYLKLLVHLIGDLHQPLHVGLSEDRGGNDFKVQWFYKDTNLHSVWDNKMIDDYGMSYTELAKNAEKLSKEEVKNIQEGTVINWVNDTHKLTRQVYANVTANDNLRYQYSYEYMGIVRDQLQKGGIRLAKVLNDLF